MNPEVIKGDDSLIGSPQWYEFLAMPSTKSFRYEGDLGTFTARKRNDGAWNAYRKSFGKLRQEYLGQTSALTSERLEAIAGKLALSNTDYWVLKAKFSKRVIQSKNITPSAEANSYTEARITELEEKLKQTELRIIELEKIATVAKVITENMIPGKSNMVKGNCLIKLKELME